MYNTASGVELDNCIYNSDPVDACRGAGSISVTGTNQFSLNAVAGIYFDAHGNVSIANVTADGNIGLVTGNGYGSGVAGESDGSITLNGGSLNNNDQYGYNLYSSTKTYNLSNLVIHGNVKGVLEAF